MNRSLYDVLKDMPEFVELELMDSTDGIDYYKVWWLDDLSEEDV